MCESDLSARASGLGPRARRLALSVGLGLSSGWLSYAAPAAAQVPSAAPPKAEIDVAGARKHFERALELYRAGNYADALPELERAAELDPAGKDLFFNLALVHEKLGQFPEAIAALERFRELETDRVELERARLSIERLRGAARAAESAPATSEPPPCADAARARAAKKPDPVLVGSASVAAVSLLVGAAFGLKALADDVKGERTSATFPITQLRERARRSEREALVADVAFAISAASAATFVGVWLLSPESPTRSAGLTLQGYF